jgi:hypothetical protein
MRLIKILLFALLICNVMPLQAHIEQTLLTSIALNPRTQRVEIIHQIYAHDVEHAFGNMLQAQGGLDQIPAQAEIAVELSASFRLWNDAGEEILLSLVGAELEAEFFYIYQEAELSAIPESMRVEHDMLRAYWPDMSNYLNVDYDGQISSLIFTANDGVKIISKE